MPVGLGRQQHVLAGPRPQPVAVGLRLQAIHLHRPVERQRNLVEEVALERDPVADAPELRVLRPRVVQPAAAFLRPPRILAVAAVGHELRELGVRDEPLARPKCRQRDLLGAVFVVPAVGAVGGRLAEPHRLRPDRQPLVPGRGAAPRTGGPEPPFLRRQLGAAPQFVERHLPHDHRRRFQVNPLVLDAHEDDPCRRIPADGKFQRHRLDELVHQVADGRPVATDRRHGGPVIVGLVEVVPRHLVHAHRHHRLEMGVDPRRDVSAGGQLVDVEDRRVREVEDQRMAEWLVALVIGGVVTDQVEEAVVERAGLVEVPPQFRPLRGGRIGGGRIGGEQHRAGGDQGRGQRREPVRCGVTGGAGGGRLHRRISGEQNPRPADGGPETQALAIVAPARSPSSNRRGIGAHAPSRAPTTAARWQLSPPQRALARTPAAKSSACRHAR